MYCRIAFVRHGETHWNRARIYQGHKDEPGCQLTPEGEMEAIALGKRLKSEKRSPFTKIFSSDLGRAQRTAALIHAEYNSALPLTTDHRLRERSFGAYEGKSRDEVDTLMSNGSDLDDGETSIEVLTRAMAAVQEIVKENVGKSVIIVAHGGTLSVLLQTILGLSLNDDIIFRIRNTSVSVVDLDENQNAIVHTLGDVAHLL